MDKNIKNTSETKLPLTKDDALIVVDPQRDFCPGGALPVPEGDSIMPEVNQWLQAASDLGCPIYISRDWHPGHHCSFIEQGGLWPQHCVNNSPGADFHANLVIPPQAKIIDKATAADEEAYSAFKGHIHFDATSSRATQTEWYQDLTTAPPKHLWIMGLALDYCVKATALDARTHNLPVIVVLSACRAISKESADAAIEEMRQAGVEFLQQTT